MSTIIIRLQNLPLSAKAADIREFFGDLKIPKGSVNIVGGPMGDAFIGFASDEDARLAMQLEGQQLHNMKIRLMLSSRREMEQVIANAQAQAIKPGSAPAQQPPQNMMGLSVQQKESPALTMMVPKSEATSPPQNVPSSSSQQFSYPFAGGGGGSAPLQSQPNFLQTQSQQAPPAAVVPPSQQAFTGDSWKHPQRPSFEYSPPVTGQTAPAQQQGVQPQVGVHQQQQPVLPPTAFPGGPPPFGGFQPPAGSGQQQQVHPPPHQYQQLPPQPPGFPPPIGQQPPIGAGGGGPPPQQQPQGLQPPPVRPPFPTSGIFGPPIGGGGGGDNFFNQGTQPGPPNIFGGPGGTQRFPPPLQQQQQQFPPNFLQNAPFRPPGGPPGQQQFGGRPPNQQQFGQQQFGGGQQHGRGGGPQDRRGGGGFGGGRGGGRGNFGGGGQGQQRQQFGGSGGGGRDGGGRDGRKRRSRSPPAGPGYGNKRFSGAQPTRAGAGGGGYGGQQQQMREPSDQQQMGGMAADGGRICIQLSNVPYKSTFVDINEYLSNAKANCIKVARVYQPDRNFSDRWIVEFDSENAAKTFVKFRGEIMNRTIRAERISARRADEQYAVAEPEGRDGGGGGGGDGGRSRPPRRDDSRRDGGRQRSRDRDDRDGHRRNRERSRSRSRERDNRGERTSKTERQEESSSSRDGHSGRGDRHSSDNGGEKETSRKQRERERSIERHLRSSNLSPSPPAVEEKSVKEEMKLENVKNETTSPLKESGNSSNSLMSSGTVSAPPTIPPNPAGTNNNNTGMPPVPLSANTFGAFMFPGTQANQGVGVYNSKSGQTVQLKPLPLRAFDIQPPQFFPNPPVSSSSTGSGSGGQFLHRPPSLFNNQQFMNNPNNAMQQQKNNINNNNDAGGPISGPSPPNGQPQQQQQSAAPHPNPPTLPPPPFRGGGGGGPSPTHNIQQQNKLQQQQQSSPSSSAGGFWPAPPPPHKATGANAIPVGGVGQHQRSPTMAVGGPGGQQALQQQVQTSQQSAGGSAASIPPPTNAIPPPPVNPLFSGGGYPFFGGSNLDISGGSSKLVIQEEDPLEDEDEGQEEAHGHVGNLGGGGGNEVPELPLMNFESSGQKQQHPQPVSAPFGASTSSSSSLYSRSSSNAFSINAIPDQPPLDLLEPENGGGQQQQQQSLPPPDPRPPPPQMQQMKRRAFDSTPINMSRMKSSSSNISNRAAEFSPQEVELRPHLLFLEHYRQDPGATTCIRLENVPKMVFVEQLADFLGAKIESPCQNIARMHNGVLYINLENENFATKAAAKNGLFLYGNQIGITQLNKSEMADAIRQNMIIIRELYRVTVVARGFPLMVQPGDVVSLFEQFNVNKEAVEKCAVKTTDTLSTYLLTFPTVQDCRNAIRELNGAVTNGGARIQVFQPEGLGI